METQRRWVVGILLFIVFACAQGISTETTSRAEQPHLTYVEQLTGGGTASETLPLLMVVHGLGDTPEHFLSLFKDLPIKARVIAPRAPDPYHGGSSWYPIDDEKRKPAIIRERARLLSQLGTQLARTRPTLGKPVLTGFSQGGVLSFAVAAEYPDVFRAVLPVAGALPDRIVASRKPPENFEVLALHGTADARIAFADGERAVRGLHERGYRASMSRFEGAGHTITLAMQEALFSLLRQRLTQGAIPAASARGATPEEVRNMKAAPKKVSPNGKATITLLAQGENAFLGKLEMAPLARVPEHQDPTEEYIHVLSGQGTLTMNGKRYDITPGATIFMPALARVSFQNSDQPFVAIQVFAGPGPAEKYHAWK